MAGEVWRGLKASTSDFWQAWTRYQGTLASAVGEGTGEMMMKMEVNWEVMVAGSKGSSPSRKTTSTMSLPRWRLRSSCWMSWVEKGRRVDTWNMISLSRNCLWME